VDLLVQCVNRNSNSNLRPKVLVEDDPDLQLGWLVIGVTISDCQGRRFQFLRKLSSKWHLLLSSHRSSLSCLRWYLQCPWVTFPKKRRLKVHSGGWN